MHSLAQCCMCLLALLCFYPVSQSADVSLCTSRSEGLGSCHNVHGQVFIFRSNSLAMYWHRVNQERWCSWLEEVVTAFLQKLQELGANTRTSWFVSVSVWVLCQSGDTLSWLCVTRIAPLIAVWYKCWTTDCPGCVYSVVRNSSRGCGTPICLLSLVSDTHI